MDPLTGIWMPALHKILHKDGVQFPTRPNYESGREYTDTQNDELLPEELNPSEEEEVSCKKKTQATKKNCL